MPSWTRTRLAAGASAAGLLAACATVGPDFRAPAAPAAAGYAMAGDAASAGAVLDAHAEAAGGWWRAFGSPDLDAAVRQALADSPTLKAADAALAQARQAAAVARGGLEPEGKLTAGLEESRVNVAAFGFTAFPSPTISLYSIGGDVSYDLDLFGGRRRAVETAEALAQAEGYRAQAAYLALSGNVTLQAIRIAALRAQIAAVRSVIDDDARNLDFIRRSQAAGAAAPSAQVSARAQMVQDQAALPGLDQQLAEARHGLALLVGRAPADWSAPDFDLQSLHLPASIPVELPSALARRRPDILAAEARLHAATAEIGVRQARLYPDIKLNAGLTQTALTPGRVFDYDFSGWSIGPAVTAPLFGRKALKADVRAAEDAARTALADYQQTVLTAFTQIADVMQALRNDDLAVAAQDAARGLAEADLKNAEFAFQKGGGSLIEVTQAQRHLSETRQAFALAQGRRFADAARLYVATAADWSAAGTPSPD